MKVRTMAELMAAGETAEILFWVGCAGSFDQRAQKITKAFAKKLKQTGYHTDGESAEIAFRLSNNVSQELGSVNNHLSQSNAATR